MRRCSLPGGLSPRCVGTSGFLALPLQLRRRLPRRCHALGLLPGGLDASGFLPRCLLALRLLLSRCLPRCFLTLRLLLGRCLPRCFLTLRLLLSRCLPRCFLTLRLLLSRCLSCSFLAL